MGKHLFTLNSLSQMSLLSGSSSGVVAPLLTHSQSYPDTFSSNPTSSEPLTLKNNIKSMADITSYSISSTGTVNSTGTVADDGDDRSDHRDSCFLFVCV